MSDGPWKNWIPGVLSKNQVAQLCSNGNLSGVSDTDGSIDHSAIDLHLSAEGFKLTKGSVKPWGPIYEHQIFEKGLAERLEADNEGIFTLKRKNTYLFKTKERLAGLSESGIYGQATAKSSIGRMDILVRLIVDGMNCYESFDFEFIDSGHMFVEITPITFDVRVKEGVSLTQLRLFYGKPAFVEFKGPEVYETCLRGSSKENPDSLHVSLEPEIIGDLKVSAFCAVEEEVPDEPLDLWKKNDDQKHEPWKYFKFIEADSDKRITLATSAFYILRSKERIALPKGICVYCRASDETLGEMRIHYAGFVHPFFGWDRKDGEDGTPLMFEVRGHDFPVNLKNGEQMARLTFYRMS